MEMHQLKALLAAAREQSFRRAAESLHVTQPSLSKSIHRLEEELGVQLFRRTPKGVVLTDFGSALLPHVERALGELEQARGAVGVEQEGGPTVLRVAAIHSLTATRLLANRLRRWNRTAAGADLHLTTRLTVGTTADVHRLLGEGKADVGLCCSPGDVPGWVYAPLYTQSVGLFAPRAIAATIHSVEQLGGVTWVQYAPNLGYRRLVDHFWHTHALRPPVAVEAADPVTVADMVRQGVGCGLVPLIPGSESPGAHSRRATARVRLPETEALCHTTFLAYRRGGNCVIDQFVAMLRTNRFRNPPLPHPQRRAGRGRAFL